MAAPEEDGARGGRRARRAVAEGGGGGQRAAGAVAKESRSEAAAGRRSRLKAQAYGQEARLQEQQQHLRESSNGSCGTQGTRCSPCRHSGRVLRAQKCTELAATDNTEVAMADELRHMQHAQQQQRRQEESR